MKIGSIEAPPEEKVCIAARNDYRSDGVLDHDFEEIIDGGSLDYSHLGDVLDENGLSEGPPDAVHQATQVPYMRTEAKKRTLIDHLMSNGHWGPFEHASRTIAIEDVTRVSMAQLTRHRNFTFDIMSLRYVQPDTGEVLEEQEVEKPMEDLFEYPDEFTADEVVDRHGVEEVEMTAKARLRAVNHVYEQAADVYNELTEAGVPNGEARKVLPMATKVNMVVTGNARSWMHLLNIRGKANVQGEARQIADGCMRECKEWMPFTFEQYDDRLPMTLNP